MKTRFVHIAAALLTLAACSGSSDPATDGTPTTDSGAPGPGPGTAQDGSTTTPTDGGGQPPPTVTDAGDASVGIGPYPAGPYGTAKGDVIADLSWEGYVNDAADAVATTRPYGPYSLDALRHSGRRYALVNLAETACPGCQKSAGELAADAKAVVDMGGAIVEVLITTGFVNPPKKTDLDAWIDKYKIPVTSVMDLPGKGPVTKNALGERETAYIVDLQTMKILEVISGSLSGLQDTSIKKGLVAMKALLVK
jgi:hypothetical protein